MDRDQIQTLFNSNELEKASVLLQPHADGDDPWALFMLGRIAWKQGRRGDAISRYSQAAAIDPESEAAVALEQAREIMDFFNTDLYNP